MTRRAGTAQISSYSVMESFRDRQRGNRLSLFFFVLHWDHRIQEPRHQRPTQSKICGHQWRTASQEDRGQPFSRNVNPCKPESVIPCTCFLLSNVGKVKWFFGSPSYLGASSPKTAHLITSECGTGPALRKDSPLSHHHTL